MFKNKLTHHHLDCYNKTDWETHKIVKPRKQAFFQGSDVLEVTGCLSGYHGEGDRNCAFWEAAILRQREAVRGWSLLAYRQMAAKGGYRKAAAVARRWRSG